MLTGTRAGSRGLDGVPVSLHAKVFHWESRKTNDRRTHMKRTIYMLVLTAFAAVSLSACNTVAGAGKDVQKVGDKMESSADKTGATSPN